jgi:uncharacterized protein with HEPN domain
MAEALGDRDAALLLDMWFAARDAREFVAGIDETGFLTSRLHQNAVIRSLEVIGEAAGKVSPELRANQAAVPWREMIGMRHRLIHGYAEVRIDLVWTVVMEQLEPMMAALAALLASAGHAVG